MLIIWGLFSTVAALYFWNDNQKQEKINTLLTESIALHKQALSNEVKSYYAINECFVVKRGLCNAGEFKKTMSTLGDEADRLYSHIANIESQLK